MKKSGNFTKASSLLLLSLALLPGCNFNFFKKEKPAAPESSSSEKSNDTNSVELCSINGKPVINEADFINNMTQMLQANPYFKGNGPSSLPMSIKRKFFDELVTQELILLDATKNNVQNDPEFQKSLTEIINLVTRSQTVQFFQKKIHEGITVSDSEITSNFNENKDRYIKTPGGVQTIGVRFNTEAQAKAFADKAVTTEAGFEKMANSDKNGTFKSFGRIGKENMSRGYQQNLAPIAIRDAALADAKFPRVATIANGKEYWVVLFVDKKEAEHFELSEIKAQLGDMIKNDKFKEALNSKIKALRSEMTVNVNEDYFKEKEAEEASTQHANASAAA